jgi:putative transposase
MIAAEELASVTGATTACHALGVPRASWYRWRRPPVPSVPNRRRVPTRSLFPAQRQLVLDALHHERFVDLAPPQVHAQLLDEGTYLCSLRTMYRLLAGAGELCERRNLLRHPQYQRPQLLATAPNQLWSWDITRLPGPRKWTYYYLYVILDVFSRFVPGWLIAESESAALAARLIEESSVRQELSRGQLTLHADRGAVMRSQPVAHLLAGLGITRTHSRPHVSNDNPFSEAQFKTLKYRPQFPRHFGSLEDGRTFARGFFDWYNHEHHHSALAWLAPATVHQGGGPEALRRRHQILLAAYQEHPERFVKGPPRLAQLPEAVWINPPEKTARQDALGTAISEAPIPTPPPAEALSLGSDGQNSFPSAH